MSSVVFVRILLQFLLNDCFVYFLCLLNAYYLHNFVLTCSAFYCAQLAFYPNEHPLPANPIPTQMQTPPTPNPQPWPKKPPQKYLKQTNTHSKPDKKYIATKICRNRTQKKCWLIPSSGKKIHQNIALECVATRTLHLVPQIIK